MTQIQNRTQLSLKEAVELLEVVSLDGLKEKDLANIEKVALKRWNPKALSASKVNQDVIDKYERNHALVGDAMDTLRRFIQGDPNISLGTDFSFTTVDYKEAVEMPIESMRVNLGLMKVRVKKAIDAIEESITGFSYGIHYKRITLMEAPMKKIMRQEVKDNVVVSCVTSALSFILVGGLIHSLLFLILGIFVSESFAMTVGGFLVLIFPLQFICCLLGALPLVRFWLPKPIVNFAWEFILVGNNLYLFLLSLGDKTGCAVFLIFIALIWIVMGVAWLFNFLILTPLILFISSFVGEKKLTTTIRVPFYEGVYKNYVWYLVNKDSRNYTEEEMYVLAYLYETYQAVWKHLESA